MLRYYGWLCDEVGDPIFTGNALHKVVLLVYLVDGSIQLALPRGADTNLAGSVLRRQKIPNPATGLMYVAEDVSRKFEGRK